MWAKCTSHIGGGWHGIGVITFRRGARIHVEMLWHRWHPRVYRRSSVLCKNSRFTLNLSLCRNLSFSALSRRWPLRVGTCAKTQLCKNSAHRLRIFGGKVSSYNAKKNFQKCLNIQGLGIFWCILQGECYGTPPRMHALPSSKSTHRFGILSQALPTDDASIPEQGGSSQAATSQPSNQGSAVEFTEIFHNKNPFVVSTLQSNFKILARKNKDFRYTKC